jgi:hypothetical protein
MQRIISERLAYKLDILSLRFMAFAVLFSGGGNSYFFNRHVLQCSSIPLSLFTCFSFTPYYFYATVLKTVQVAEGTVASTTHRQLRYALRQPRMIQAYMKLA